MKESIGGFSLFNIVIVFILIFTGYVSFSINYSKAYNVKNEIINIIRNQGGVCTSNSPSDANNCYNFTEQIIDYFKEANYRSTGNCKDGWIGFSRDGQNLGADAKNAAFCVNAINANTNSELPNALYYQIKVFYQLDIPIIKTVMEFSVFGETSRVYSPNECTEDPSMYSWCN